VPFWSSPLHPVLYVAYALRGGIAGLLLVQSLSGAWHASLRELLMLWIGVTAATALLFALEMHGALSGASEAARRSARALLAGLPFYGGTLLLGIAIPAWIVAAGLTGPLPAGAALVLAATSALGDFFVKYSTIRAGVHLPVRASLGQRS
jgi:formate-dependent nitrite reductase membrane component NrfD